MKKLSLTMMALAAAGLMTMVSCRKPNMINNVSGAPRMVTFDANTESGAKTHLEGLDVVWTEGDVISVNGGNVQLTSGAGSRNGKFQSEVSGTEFYAGYPVSAVSYTAPSTLSISIPAVMEYNAENPTEGLVRMVAHATSDGDKAMLNFKNAVNVLKLQLKGDGTTASNLTSIVLKSTSNLNGNIAVTFNGQNATFGYADGGNTSTITFGDGLQLRSDETKYVYILLPKINGGDLTIKFNCSNSRYMRKEITVTAEFNNVNNTLSTPELMVKATNKPVSVDPEVSTYDVCDACEYKGANGRVRSSTTQECEYGIVYAKTSVNDDPTIGGNGCVKFPCAIGDVKSAYIRYNADLDLEDGVGYSFKAYAIGENENEIYGAVKTTIGFGTPQALPSTWTNNNGTNPHPFTVGKGTDGIAGTEDDVKVYFSQGNLQYIGSAATQYWKLADHQFDIFGTTTGQNSASQTVDRDLFGWGTSGWNNGNQYYQPYDTEDGSGGSGNYLQGYGYGPKKDDYPYCELNLTGDYANADWGVYNAISNGGNAAGMWRTLTEAEWSYLLSESDNAKWGEGRVRCIRGLIILPDDWDWDNPALSDLPSFTSGESRFANVYSYTQWHRMEAVGAVFLPCAGERIGTELRSPSIAYNYWTTDRYGASNAASVRGWSNYQWIGYPASRTWGCAVRLVR